MRRLLILAALMTGAPASALERVDLGLSSTYRGNSLGDLSNPRALSASGATGSDPIAFESKITAAYALSEMWSMGPEIPFAASPVLGGSLAVGVPLLKITYKPPHLRSGLHVSLPVAWQYPLNLRFSPSVRYDLPHTRWTVGGFSEFKTYLIPSTKTFRADLEPFVAYWLRRGIALSLLGELEVRHNVGDTFPFDLTLQTLNLQPGVVVMFSPDSFLNPYLQIFPLQGLTLDHMAVGANLTLTLL